jgi:DNA-binding transcriptional regulator YiaG
VTLALQGHDDAATVRLSASEPPLALAAYESKPVEFWPTAAIRMAIESGDLTMWQRIVVALKRDPFGRTARQVEEVVDTGSSYGISKALSEVLTRGREQLQANERAEVAQQIKILIDRSGLSIREFASRIGASAEDLTTYLDGAVSPSAAMMVRMRRLSDRFAKMKAQRSTRK